MTPGFDTDKISSGYVELYRARIGRPRRILEVGVKAGGSLQLWCAVWPEVEKVVGIDVQLPSGFTHPKVELFEANQNDTALLADIGTRTGPFDLIIDDASHVGTASWATFLGLWPHVCPGGIYAIEDWGTGYWAHWPDGQAYVPIPPPGHVAGMVGLIKRLVDELDNGEASRLELLPGLAFLHRRRAADDSAVSPA